MYLYTCTSFLEKVLIYLDGWLVWLIILNRWRDRTVKLWEVDTKLCVQQYTGRGDVVRDIKSLLVKPSFLQQMTGGSDCNLSLSSPHPLSLLPLFLFLYFSLSLPNPSISISLPLLSFSLSISLSFPSPELKTEACSSCTQILITLLCTHALLAASCVSGISVLANVWGMSMDMRPSCTGMSSEWVHVHVHICNNAIFLLHMIDFSECHCWPFFPPSICVSPGGGRGNFMSCWEDSTVRVWRGQCVCTVCVRIVCRISFRIFIKRGKHDIYRVRG